MIDCVSNSFLCSNSFPGPTSYIDGAISEGVNAPIANELETNLGVAGSIIAGFVCTALKIISLILSTFIFLATLPCYCISLNSDGDNPAELEVSDPILYSERILEEVKYEGENPEIIVETSLHEIPELEDLVEKVKSGEECAPYNRLVAYWDKSGLKEKSVFARVFSTDEHLNFKGVRNYLGPHIYHFPNPYGAANMDEESLTDVIASDPAISPAFSDKEVIWLSSQELMGHHEGRILKRDSLLAKKVDRAVRQSLLESRFFHGTRSLEAVKSILKDRRVRVHAGACGDAAYASFPRPEPTYAPFFFGFRENIAYTSPLLLKGQFALQGYGYFSGPIDESDSHPHFWIPFRGPIPVTEQTLAAIVVDVESLKISSRDESSYCENLSKQCEQWGGYPIKVIPWNRYVQNELIQQIAIKRAAGLPRDWIYIQDD